MPQIVQELTFILPAEELFTILKQGGDFSFGFALNFAIDSDGKIWNTISVAERISEAGAEKISLRDSSGKAVPTPPGSHGGRTINITTDTKSFFDSVIPNGAKTLTQFNSLLSQ